MLLRLPFQGKSYFIFSFSHYFLTAIFAGVSSELLKTVHLKPHEAKRLCAGHPWVYPSEIESIDEDIADGDCVQVSDSRNRLIGSGLYNSKSKIRVRLLSLRHSIYPDLNFFESRIENALKLRLRSMPGATSFRVVNAESDFLSGLIIDKYNDILVLQTTSLGMDQRKPIIIEVLQKILKPRVILEKNDSPSRSFEGLDPVYSTLLGQTPEGTQPIELNKLSFQVDFSSGHKTACYLDQQVNYQLVSQFAPGARVLDCFCFLGGFALHAARAGAREVLGIDQSLTAVKIAEISAQLNHLPNCSFINENVFDWLIQETKKTEIPENSLFDLIILDPPSFTRNRHTVEAALRGYKEIHLRALKLLRPGGILATFCCSHHVSSALFQEIILQAAFDAHKILRRVCSYTQSPDHPVIPVIPETEYLKGFAFEVLNG